MDTNIYFIYSQYCKHCKKILSKLPLLQENIYKICIDNKQFRQRILSNTLYTIEYVPCLIIFQDENVTIYQGSDASNYIKDKLSILNNKNNNIKELQHKLNISYEQLEKEKNNSLNLQSTISKLQSKFENQISELTSTKIERTPPPIQQSNNQSMRTSISDLMDDSDEEDEEISSNKPQSINDLAKKLQEGRQ